MTTERPIKEIAAEYIGISSQLSGFSHTESLDAEFQLLHSLEGQLFTQGRIKEDPNLLLHMSVSFKSDNESQAINGVVQGVETSPDGKLMALVIKGHGQVLYQEGITTISPFRQPIEV